MTSAELSNWERYEEQERTKVQRNKDALIPVLRSNGIKYVVIEYNGYGDSGQVEDVAVYGAHCEVQPENSYETEGRIDMPDVIAELPEEKGKKLQTVLEDFGWDTVTAHHGGFENNEGGQGQVLIDVEAGKVRIEHGDNYVEVHSSSTEIE